MVQHSRGFIACSILLGLTLAACGGGSPTSPSSTDTAGGAAGAPAPAPAPTGSATVSGQVVAPGSALSARVTAGAALPGVTVTVLGTSINAVADGNGRFRLSNVPSGNQQLEFRGAGASGARLPLSDVGEQERIEITVAVGGTSAEIVSQERVTGKQAQLEGPITAVNDGAHTFEVGTTTVQVPAGVRIRHGGTTLEFSNLHVNDRVHVKGTLTGDVLAATEINVQQGQDTPGNGNGGDDSDDDGGDDNGGAREATLSGTVASLAGQCPTLTFKIKGTAVTTTAATEFAKGSCSDVRNGRKVEAEGLLTGSTMTAAKVSIEK